MKKDKKRYKFIHIFFHDGLIYVEKEINMFLAKENGFDLSEHHFVTVHQRIYDKFKDKIDIEFIEYGVEKPVKMIHYCAERGDWLFFNAICSPSKFVNVKNKYLPKIIWRTWAHDAYGVVHYKEKPLGTFIKKLLNHKKRWERNISKIKAIGCCGMADVVFLKSRFPNLPMVSYLYPEDVSIEQYNEWKKPYEKKDDTVRVILGHSTARTDNHMPILKMLDKFSKENVEIYMPMTYGYPPYIKEVEDFIKENKITVKNVIMQDFMTYSEYAEFIRKCDIMILDAEYSCGLGNLYLALHMKKKLFLNKDGVMKKAFDVDNIPCAVTSDIENMSFEEFKKPFEYDATNSTLSLPYPNKSVELWHDLLNWLKGTGEIDDLSKKFKEK